MKNNERKRLEKIFLFFLIFFCFAFLGMILNHLGFVNIGKYFVYIGVSVAFFIVFFGVINKAFRK